MYEAIVYIAVAYILLYKINWGYHYQHVFINGWFAVKCLISGPDTLRSYKQENRNGGKFLSVDLYSLRSYS